MNKRLMVGAWLMVGLLSSPTVFAQSTSSGLMVVRMLQGEAVSLPADYVARVTGDELSLTLDTSSLNGAPDELSVALVSADGRASEPVVPDADGKVILRNVSEGLSALVVTGKQLAYAAMAVYVEKGATASPPVRVPLAAVDRNQIRAVSSAGNAPAGPAATPLSGYSPKPANRFRVSLQNDGSLIGRVIVPEQGFESQPGTFDLFFFRNGIQVGATRSMANGNFYVQGLTSGIHSVFAIGAAGHASFAFDVVAPAVSELPAVSDAKAPATKFVSTTANMQAANELIILIIPPRLMPGVRQIVDNAYPPVPGAPFPVDGFGPTGFPGGFGGGGFAGGGGFGGGGGGGIGPGLGGLGGLLGIAGLAAGVAALSNEDDDGFNAPAASLIIP